MKIKSIHICFENCELVELLPSMFKNLIIEEITRNKTINCYQYEDGEAQDMTICRLFTIELNEKGLDKQCWNTKLRDRLKGNDIVGIDLNYENGTKEEIYVPWNEENEFINKYQKNHFEENNATIIIEKGDTNLE